LHGKGAEWCTAREAADILGVSPDTARRRIRDGTLQAEKTHNGYVIRRADVEALALQMHSKSTVNAVQSAAAFEVEVVKMLRERIEELETEKTNSEHLKTEVSELKQKIPQLESDNTRLQERVRDLEADKAYLQERIVALERHIEALTPKALSKPKNTIKERIRVFFQRK